MKNFIKTVIFLAILVFILFKIGNILSPKWVTYDILHGYKSLKKNTVDVLFIGDSDIYSDISPMELYQEYGITSYDYAAPAASNLLMYYMLEEALKTQTPKVVVMDGTTIFGDHESEAMRHQATDLMPLDDVKWRLVNDTNYNFKFGEKLSILMPFFRYHDRWNKIKGNDFNKGSNKDTYAKGYILLNDKNKTKYNKDYMDDLDQSIEFKTSYLPDSVIKAKEYCEARGIKFLFVTMPDASTWSYAKYEKLKTWTSDNNIDYLDYNELLNKINLDFGTDSVENGMHLNINGAIKVSKYMGKYLNDNYSLDNHLNDDTGKLWHNSVKKYNEERDKYLESINQ
jgi:hypothetical protein